MAFEPETRKIEMSADNWGNFPVVGAFAFWGNHMAVSSNQVTVGASATLIFADSGSVSGCQVKLKNPGATVVFVGPSGVTTANGYSLGQNEVLAIELGSGEELYGITASGSQAVQVLVTRN